MGERRELMDFDLRRYLGKWYEIARIENEFEPKMDKVEAQYNLNDDGSIQVINSGYVDGNFRQIVGHAITTENKNILKVSFFPGIYSDYRVLVVGKNYDYALVGGNKDTYLWILSRTPDLDENIVKDLIQVAKEKSYKVDKIRMTEQ